MLQFSWCKVGVHPSEQEVFNDVFLIFCTNLSNGGQLSTQMLICQQTLIIMLVVFMPL